MEDPDYEAEKVSLAARLGSSFNDPTKFPDLTVTLDGHKWLCHKVVLCAQSEWFLKACSGGFKEGGASEIEIHEQDPRIFAAALQYCYTLEVDPQPTEDHESIKFLMFWTRLFAVAEFYMIQGLASFAAERFIIAINPIWIEDILPTENVAELIHQVYTTTTDPTRLLRDAVIKKTLENLAEYLSGEESSFTKLIEAVPEFSVDLVKAMAQLLAPDPSLAEPDLYECPGCDYTFEDTPRAIATGDGDDTYSNSCDKCGEEYTYTCAMWKEHWLLGPMQ